MGNIIRVGKEVFGETAVPGVAAELRLSTHRFPVSQAILSDRKPSKATAPRPNHPPSQLLRPIQRK